MLQRVMITSWPISLRISFWCLCYLWSVPVALAICSFLQWRYDSDLGWWLTATYVLPAGGIILAIKQFITNEQYVLYWFFGPLLVASIAWFVAHSRYLTRQNQTQAPAPLQTATVATP